MDLEIKRGDTLDHFSAFQLIAEDGSLLDPTDWTPTSQVLFTDGSRQNLTATKVNDSTLRLRGDTATWLVGRAYIDVQFDGPGGHVVSSETIHVKVLQDVTIGP